MSKKQMFVIQLRRYRRRWFKTRKEALEQKRLQYLMDNVSSDIAVYFKTAEELHQEGLI